MNVHIYIIILMSVCVSCYNSKFKASKLKKDDIQKYTVNVTEIKLCGVDGNCKEIKKGLSEEHITVPYNEDDSIELLCESFSNPHILITWQQNISNQLIVSQKFTKPYIPYKLKMPLDIIDADSYIYCENGFEALRSKKIYLKLHSSALPDFINYHHKYFNKSDPIKTHICYKGIRIIKFRNGTINVSKEKYMNMSLTESDNGTVAVCIHYTEPDQDEVDGHYLYETKRLIEMKHIYLYKKDGSDVKNDVSSSATIIAGIIIPIIMLSLIGTTVFCWWKNGRKNNLVSTASNNDSSKEHIYAEIDLPQSSTIGIEFRNNQSPYATIIGVVTPKNK